MSSSTPSSPHISSHPPRSRASSDISVISPHLLHRPRTGRIQRNRSSSSRVSSLRNQEAIWEAATGRNWAQDDSHPSPEPSLPESIPPLSLSIPDFYTESDSPLSLPPLRSLPELESSPSLVDPTSTASEAEAARDALWYDSKQISEPPKTTLSSNSMEFMMPPQYNHFGSYSSSYHSNYLEQYSGADQERAMAHSSPQPSSYAPSYATSPAVVASSPALSPRTGSIEGESAHHYPAARSPYAGGASSTQAGYGYATGHQAASMPAQYASGYTTSNDHYGAPNPYGMGFAHGQSTYVAPQAAGYGSQYPAGASAYEQSAGAGSEDPAGVRVVNSRPKPQCWEHGCNGRQFSTFSNLLRHQREKSGAAQKSTCPRCGAVFTRTTARNGHMAHDKCKRRSTTSTSEPE